VQLKRSVWIIIFRPFDGKYLLLKRAENIKNGNKWNFPGGGVEPNENPKDAARRELKEESGLALNIRPLAIVELPGKEIHYYYAIVDVGVNPILNKESSAWDYFSLKNCGSESLHIPTAIFFNNLVSGFMQKITRDDKNLFNALVEPRVQYSWSKGKGIYNIKVWVKKKFIGSGDVLRRNRRLYNFRTESKYQGKGYADLVMKAILNSDFPPNNLVALPTSDSHLTLSDTVCYYYKHWGFRPVKMTVDGGVYMVLR
jgi:ADP-ribose pyrophosphatase YjhB (NUDIX family)